MTTKIEALEKVTRDHRERAEAAAKFLAHVERVVGAACDPAGHIDTGTYGALEEAASDALTDAIEEVLMWKTARASLRAAMKAPEGLHEVFCKHRGSKRDEAREAWVCDACGAVLKDGGNGWVRP
jgi:rubrerythrin